MRHRLRTIDVIRSHEKLEIPLAEAKRERHPLLDGECLTLPALLFAEVVRHRSHDVSIRTAPWRLNGIQEVVGSIPISSTNSIRAYFSPSATYRSDRILSAS